MAVLETKSKTTKRKKKWILWTAGLILGVALAIVGFILYSHTSNYLSVDQFQPKSDTYYGRQVSLSGQVAPGSVNWDEKDRLMKFELMEGSTRVAVQYQGLVPENFKPGADLVVNGRYGADKVLLAQSFGKVRSLCSICH